ncbi:hypothetical protein ACOMHN_053034 [Nucella lapillus]
MLVDARRRLQSATARHGVNSTEERTARCEFEFVHSTKAGEFADQPVDEICRNTFECHPSAAWKALNKLCRRKLPALNCLSADSVEDRKGQLQQHYSRILNAEAPHCDSDPPTQPVSGRSEEVVPELSVAEICSVMKGNTAPGPDGIPARILMIPELVEEITSVLNSHSKISDPDNQVSREWTKSVIVSIPKKGSSKSLDNQRGISKTCALAKLFYKTLTSGHIRTIVDPKLMPIQSGFRSGRSKNEQLMSLRVVLDTCRTTKRRATINFVDFRKAFDSLFRGSILSTLADYGIPPEVIADVMQLYKDTTASGWTQHSKTKSFSTSSGVLQGDTLSLFLFFTVLDSVLRQTLQEEDGFTVKRRRSSRQPETKLCSLAYADNTALILDTPDGAERTLHQNGVEY